jgi:TatA/E family protein of Tat protein translocase
VEGIFSPMHLVIVAIIALVIFGPKRLPELGKSLGVGIREFKTGINGLHEDFGGGSEDNGAGRLAATAAAPRVETSPVVVTGEVVQEETLQTPGEVTGSSSPTAVG